MNVFHQQLAYNEHDDISPSTKIIARHSQSRLSFTAIAIIGLAVFPPIILLNSVTAS